MIGVPSLPFLRSLRIGPWCGSFGSLEICCAGQESSWSLRITACFAAFDRIGFERFGLAYGVAFDPDFFGGHLAEEGGTGWGFNGESLVVVFF